MAEGGQNLLAHDQAALDALVRLIALVQAGGLALDLGPHVAAADHLLLHRAALAAFSLQPVRHAGHGMPFGPVAVKLNHHHGLHTAIGHALFGVGRAVLVVDVGVRPHVIGGVIRGVERGQQDGGRFVKEVHAAFAVPVVGRALHIAGRGRAFDVLQLVLVFRRSDGR